MGIEYRLRFKAPSRETIAEILRKLPMVAEATQPAPRFDLGAAGQVGPQASVQLEPDGVYFCDHCAGSGPALLGNLVVVLVSAFGAVTVEEL